MQYGIINRQPAELARTSIRTIDKECAKLLINAFNTTYYSGADTAALCSSSHTPENGGSNQSNTGTGVLNYDNLETAMVTLMETKNGRGELVDVEPNTLLVPPALAREAMVLAETKGKPSSTDNDVNVYQGKFEVVVWKRLGSAAGGSDTAWFLLDSNLTKDQAGLKVFMRVNPFIEQEKETETHVNKWIGYMRFSLGFTDWRGIYGSTGAA